MKTVNLDLNAVNDLRVAWRDEAITAEWNQDRLELLESSFDFIISNQYFGDPFGRDNKVTYIVLTNDDGKETALSEIIASSRGRERTVKIMKIEVAPHIEGLDKEEYDLIYAQILAHLAASFFVKSRVAGSVTKVYANDHADKKYLSDLHSQLSGADLNELNLKVKFEGQRWLAFELTKTIE